MTPEEIRKRHPIANIAKYERRVLGGFKEKVIPRNHWQQLKQMREGLEQSIVAALQSDYAAITTDPQRPEPAYNEETPPNNDILGDEEDIDSG